MELQNPADIQKIEDPILEELYWQTLQQLEDLEAQKVEIKAEFDRRLQDRKRNSIEAGESAVTRYPKVYTNKVTIDEARKFAAVKVEEKVNSALITKLHKSGVKIEGVEERWELRIAKMNKDKEATA